MPRLRCAVQHSRLPQPWHLDNQGWLSYPPKEHPPGSVEQEIGAELEEVCGRVTHLQDGIADLDTQSKVFVDPV